MDIRKQVKEMDEMIVQGAIVDAVEKFFAQEAETSDYNQLTTKNKGQMIEKMKGFTGAIAAVNGIKFHDSLVDENTSASEFTFDFQMKDGTSILWHEIIKREWNENGEVIFESYFNAQ